MLMQYLLGCYPSGSPNVWSRSGGGSGAGATLKVGVGVYVKVSGELTKWGWRQWRAVGLSEFRVQFVVKASDGKKV